MTYSRFTTGEGSLLNSSKSFVKYLLTLVVVMSAMMPQVFGVITVNSTPQAANDFCGVGAPSLTLPSVATSNCGAGTISYQWYVDGGGGSSIAGASAIVAAGTPNYSGYNTSTLIVGTASALGGSTTYFAILTETSGACNAIDTIGPFNYQKVTAVPTVTLTSSFDVCELDDAAFTATVTAPSPAGSLTYNWYRMPDGGSNTLVQTTAGVAALTDGYDYATVLSDDQDDVYVTVTNVCGTTTSSTSTVTVDPLPDVVIPSGMSSLSACEGDNVSITYTISNAVRDASSGGTGVAWTIAFTGDAALTALLTAGGTGNTAVGLSVGAGLSPGVYNASISTITNTDDGCPRTISTNSINVTIYPEPTVTFSATPSNICNGSGSGTTFDITVANAEYTDGTSTVAVNWQATITEDSYALLTGCTGGAAGLLGTTVSGTGNGIVTYTIPTTMGVGIYQYTLTAITNTTNGCTGTVIGTSVVDWRVDPTPNIAVIPTSTQVCEGISALFTINSTNARFCGTTPGSGTASDVDWSLSYTDNTLSTIGASPLTGIGNGINGPYTTSAALASGIYTFTPGTITVTTPAAPACARTITGNTFSVTVNPNPSVTFNTAAITQCEGTSGTTFSVDVTNAMLSGVGQNWTVAYTAAGASALSTTPCAAGTPAGILTGSLTGTGNGSTVFTIPSTLSPGYYTYTLSQITNTSGGCTSGGSSVGANPTITIIIEPAPIITMNPDVNSVCENDAQSFNLQITNTIGCSAIGTSYGADWTLTGVVDNVISDITTVISGGTGTGNSTYAIGVNTSGALTPDDHTLTASVYNTTGGTSCGISDATTDVYTVSVDPRPDILIEGVTGSHVMELCEGDGGDFDFVVSNALQDGNAVDWEITYSESSGNLGTNCSISSGANQDFPGGSGSYTGSGNGANTITIPTSTPVGQYVITVSNIVNTDGPCTGTVDGVTLGTQTITINVYPKPSFTVQPATSEICEGFTAFGNFQVVVTNAQYCSSGSQVSAGWSVSGITDLLASNAPSPITGTGNGVAGPYNSNTATTLTAGDWTYTATSITTTGLPVACANTISANNVHTLTVNPAPIVTFTTTPVSVCEGTAGSIGITVSNAVLNTADVNWSFSVTESSGNLTSSCQVDANENATMVPATVTGSGNSTLSYTIPSTLVPGVYTYTITGITNTDKSCTGSVTPSATVTVYVYPKLAVSVSPTAAEVCEGDNTTFSISVTNARYCSALNSASVNVPWDLNYTDATNSNIFPDPLTGNGNSNFTFTANNGGLLAAGVYDFTATSIDGNITTPTSTTCSQTLTTGNKFTLTVNPEPVATFSASTLSLCEGTAGTFDIDVTNAVLVATGVPWSLDISGDSADLSSSCASGGSGAGIIPLNGTTAADVTGTGNSTITYNVPNTLLPGVYTYTIVTVTNNTPPCTGSVGANATITITIYPKPDVTVSTNALTVCENTTATVDLTVTNAEYCASVGGSPISVNWEMTHTDATQSTIPSSIWSGFGNMSATTYTVNAALGLTAGTYNFDISQIENTTHSCTNTDFSGVELVVTVDDLPTLTINSITPNVCDGGTATINYSVSDVLAGENWTFDYTVSSTTNTESGTGPVSGATITTIALTPPGVKTVTFTAITNSTTSCVGNTAASVATNVLTLPDVSGFSYVTDDEICSGLTNDYSFTVSNSAGKAWIIGYTIAGVSQTAWTGTGNGTFTRSIPAQGHSSSTGAHDTRPIEIDSIAWTGGTGTPPLCANTSPSDHHADLIVMPRPYIDLVSPVNVCVNYTATINYTVSGIRSGDAWDFDWYTTGPTDGPNNLTGGGPSPVTGTFTTLGLTPVGTSTVYVPTVTNTLTGCDSSNSSWSDDIIVDPPTVPGTLSPSYTICDGDVGPFTFTLTGYTGDIQHWDSSENLGYLWFDIGNAGNATHTVTSPHLTTDYHVVVKSGACPEDTSNDVRLFVHPQPSATFVSQTDSICAGSTLEVVFDVSGVPNTHNWKLDYTVTVGSGSPTAASWTGTGSSATNTKTLGSYSSGPVVVTFTKLTNTNTGCDTTLTDSRTTKVKQSPVGSTASTSQTLCQNSNGIVEWDGSATDGYVVGWQKKVGSGSWTNISGTANDTFEFVGLTTTTMYRAVIENYPCTGQAFSSAATITIVASNPTAEFVSLPSSNEHCASATTTTTFSYKISGTNGNSWTLTLLEEDSLHTITGTGDVTNTFTTSPGKMQSTFSITLIKLVITSGSTTCTKNLDNTATATVTIIDLPTASLNSVTTPVCDGDSVTMTYTVTGIKATENWSMSYAINSNSKTVTGSQSGTFSLKIPHTVSGGNATQSVVLTSITNTSATTSAGANCTNSLSGQTLNYVVRSATSPGTIGTSASICDGASGYVTQSSASSNGSIIIDWLSSTWNAGSWSAWASTGNSASTQAYVNLGNTTRYQAVYSNSPCDSAGSNIVTITVLELPTATLSLTSGNEIICDGATSTVTVTVANIASGQTFRIDFTEGSTTRFKTFTHTGASSYTFTTLALSATTVISLDKIQTTSGTTCTNTALNSSVTVTVDQNPTATIASADKVLCEGSTVDYTVTVGSLGSSDSWTLNLDLDGSTETVTGTGDGTFSFTTSSTVSPTSDVLTLNLITNNSTQDACKTSLSDSKTIAVDATTEPGEIGTSANATDTTICVGGSAQLKEYGAGTGNIVKWQSRVKSSSTWIDLSTNGTVVNVYNVNDTTFYRATYQNGVCLTALSNVVAVNPRELPLAVISDIVDDSICAGTTADWEITVTNVLSGQDFTVYYTEGSVSKSATFTQSSSGVHSLTTGALTATSLLQLTSIDVTSGTPQCSDTLSSNGTVTVLSLPYATITAGPDTLCQLDAITFTVNVSNVASTDAWSLIYELENDQDTINGTGPGSFTTTDTDSNSAESAKIQLIEILNLANLGVCKSVNTDDWDIFIYKPTEPGEIGENDTICKGSSTTISEVTGTPKQGVTVSWEYKPESASSWTALANNNTTLNVINLLETTSYRAIYKSGVCDTAHSNVVTIEIRELPLATISGSTSICSGDSTDLTVTVTNVGSTQDWTIEYLVGTQIAYMTGNGGGTFTLKVGNFITTSDVTLREISTTSGIPTCTNDKLTNKATATVNINQRPYASLNSVNTPVCQQSVSTFTVTVSNVRSSDNWTLTYDVDDAVFSATKSGTGPGTYTITTPTLTDDKTYNVKLTHIVNNTTSCDSNLTSTLGIVVDATTQAGSVASDTTVCYGAHTGTITHTGGNGSIVRWEVSQDNGVSWATISNTASTYTYYNLTNTSKFRVVKRNGTICAEAATSPVTITINALPVASISGSDTICAGTAGTVTVTAINTQGEDWNVSYLVGTRLDTISVSGPLTSGTINTGNLNMTTDITLKKVWMTSGVPQCENNNLTNNATGTVEVNDLPAATLISLTDSVCTGSPAFGKTTISNVRSYENWRMYWSINGGAADSVSGTGAGSFNFTTMNLTVDPSTVRLVKVVNLSTGCDYLPTDEDSVIVSPVTVGGTLAGATTVCKDDNSGSLTLGSDARGTIIRWESSTDGGTTWSTINNTASTYSYSDISGTTSYRVLVKNGACGEEYSSVAVVTVNELPIAEIVSVGANSICSGSNTYVALNITNVASGLNWDLKYLQGSSVKTLSGTGPGSDTIFTGTLTTTTDITLQTIVITSGSPRCENLNLSNNYTTTITVIDNPKATITSYPKAICVGTTPTVTVLVDNVKSGESWTVVYRVSNGSNITSTGVGAGQFNLNNMPAFNTEGPQGVRLVSITNTSTTPNCTGQLTDSITIQVDSLSVGGTVSGVSIVCKGDGGTLNLSGQRGDIVKWQSSTDGINYYDIANTSDSLVFTNLTTKTWYRAVVQNGVCDEENSSVMAVDVQELPTLTITNATQDICSGTSTTVSVTIGNVSSSDTWTVNYKENGTSGSYTGGTGTTETITFGPYTATTTIEFTNITLTSGLGCANTLSEKAVITVIPNPTATINTVPDSLCEDDFLTFTVSVDDIATGTSWALDYDMDNIAGSKKGTGSGIFTVNTGRKVSPSQVKILLTTIALDNTLGCSSSLNDSAIIKVSPTSVGGTLSPTTTTICYGGSATLTLTGETGAIMNWEYSTDGGATWTLTSNNTNVLTVTNVTETTEYRVYVKSGTCSGAYSTVATVVVIPTPQATVTSNAKVCPGDLATFTLHVTDVAATDGWSVVYKRNGVTIGTPVTGTGSGDFDFSVTGGTYTGNPSLITVELVSITNTTHGCTNSSLTSSASARITPNPIAAFTASNDCQDSVIVFNNSSSIPEGSITTYRWYFGDGDSSINGSTTHVYSAAGTYSVRLVVWSDNGCRGEVTHQITVYPNPVADFTFSNVCKNDVFSATDASTISSGSIVSWAWTFGDGTTSTAQNPTHVYSASGNYDVTLTVTSANGCSNTISKELTVYILPEANFVAAPVCEDDAMNFVNASAIGYGTMTYDWDFAGQGTSTDKDPSMTFSGFGEFSVRLIAISNNGCRDTIVRNVTVHPEPTASFTVAPVCIGETSTFVNTSTVPTGSILEYYWDFGDLSFSGLENPTHMYDAPGSYDVVLRVKSDKGCENTFTAKADVIDLPDVELTAGGPTEFCDGDSVQLSANANARTYEWSWTGGTSTDPSIFAKTTGWYKVRITAPPIGCANEDSIFIDVWPLPDAKAWLRDDVTLTTETISRGQTIEVHASGGVTYDWNPTTYLNPITGPDVTAERVDVTTSYTVTVTDANGCVNTAEVTIIVLDDFNLTVYNAVTPNGDGMNDTWIIENIWAYPDATVIIFNRYGMEVHRETGYNNTWDATYKGNDLPDGPYYYVITHPDFGDTVYKGVINVIRERK
jgi:gliding motility-associated-like protein